MLKFSQIESVAIPLDENDVDTDAIFPAQFLLLLTKENIGQYLFASRRSASSQSEPIIFDEPQYKGANILVAGDRFGIGSSREHAVWALADFGIRCVIAKSFGEIFYANCLKNGVLPLELDKDLHGKIMEIAKSGGRICVDLEAQHISLIEGRVIEFDLPSKDRQLLLDGRDEIDKILSESSERIEAFEKNQATMSPWLQLNREQLSSFSRPQPQNQRISKT